MGRPAGILIVEDDHLLAHMYQLRLQAEQLPVSVAHNADEFWQQLAKHKPTVIVLDILLPKVNGLHILKDLRSHSRYAKIPVIILTNLNRVEIELTPELADVLGVTAYLVKSQTTPETLVRWVKRAITSKA